MAIVSRTYNTSVSHETRSQEAATRQWAKAHSVRIVRWFRESICGTTNPCERPAFQDMLTALHSNSVKLVICEKYDRVARGSMWREWAIRHLRGNGFSLVSASEPELADDTDPHRKAMRGMISIFAELEKSALVLKLRAARQRAREQAVVTIGKVESPMALTTSVVRPDREINTETMRRRPANAICGKSNTSEARTVCAGVPVMTEKLAAAESAK